MTPAPNRQEDLRRLFMALLDGTLSTEEIDRLSAILHADADARSQYHDLVEIHALLYWEHGQPEELREVEFYDRLLADQENLSTTGAIFPSLMVDEENQESTSSENSRSMPGLEFLGGVFQSGIDVLSRPLVLTLLLAIGLPGILLLMLVINVAHQPASTSPVVAARITKSHSAVWSEQGAAMVPPAELLPGERLNLREGLAEITFTNGARVVLQGPAALRVEDAGDAFLKKGSLAATVPERARGFTVRTPLAKVVDLGTEFGVSVAEDGVEEAHVFQGEIEVAARHEPGRSAPVESRLHAGEAVRVSASRTGGTPQIVAMAAVPPRFVRRVPEKLPEPTILFAHRGDADPRNESWTLRHRNSLRADRFKCGPVAENGTKAWLLQTPVNDPALYYDVRGNKKLPDSLMAEASKQGWVFRARVWLDEKAPRQENPRDGLCLLSYRDDSLAWYLHLSLDPQGTQRVLLRGRSSLGADAVVAVSDSQNQYVDYELRHEPGNRGADVYVNGRCVATGFSMPTDGNYRTVRFGLYRHAASTRFALVEWGILGDTSVTPADGTDATRDQQQASETESAVKDQ